MHRHGLRPPSPCCNGCSRLRWLPEPTLDSVTWSGSTGRLGSSEMDCNTFDRIVVGTWLREDAFEVTSVRPAAGRKFRF